MIACRMSCDQEVAIKTLILKTAGKEIRKKFPWVVEAIEHFDTMTGDIKYLIILDETCRVNGNNMQNILQTAEDDIKI